MSRFVVRLALLGLIGTLSLLLAPLERLVPVDANPLAFRLMAMIQPAILGLGALFLGAWAAPKVGLDAPVVRAWADRRPIWPELKEQIPAAVVIGLLAGLVLLAFASAVSRAELTEPLKAIELPLATKLLYGGIVEELLLRWGVMSLLVWIAWRLSGRREPVPPFCYWAGATVAAVLFAVGHLPVLFLLVPDPPSWLLALVLAANAVPGLMFGWLYWRRGLEAAMLAHALAHLFSTAALSLL